HSDGSVSYKHPSEMDGRILAHVENRAAASSDIVSVDPSGGPEKNLTASPTVDERHPFYNAAVDLVTFHSDETGDKNVWIATQDLSRRVQLTFYGKAAQSPSWSPDGRRLYFVKKLERQAEGEPFYKRQADIRTLDVPKALKSLKKQAKERVRELQSAGAPEAEVASARKALEDYKFFLERYE
ncbi:MAG: hypothetical protein K8I02_08065, partial [Candidatus Methylomirabilis sp.]|nr:hypothetical protein [Deltaproteobacteria bacterium]